MAGHALLEDELKKELTGVVDVSAVLLRGIRLKVVPRKRLLRFVMDPTSVKPATSKACIGWLCRKYGLKIKDAPDSWWTFIAGVVRGRGGASDEIRSLRRKVTGVTGHLRRAYQQIELLNVELESVSPEVREEVRRQRELLAAEQKKLADDLRFAVDVQDRKSLYRSLRQES